MPAVDISNLKAQRNRLTHGWNEDSIAGQAAVLIIRQAASYCYDCLATGYGMKMESSILAQKVEQQTDDMVVKVIEKSLEKKPRHKPQLSTYITQLKRLQIDWESLAQKRYTMQLKHTLRSPQSYKILLLLWQLLVWHVPTSHVGCQ